jgi:hypothetical protein
MTFASPVATAAPAAADAAPEALDREEGLQSRIAAAAAHAGTSEADLCQAWLLEGLERFEALHGLQAAGRCSLRTGTCTVGPVALPVQQ